MFHSHRDGSETSSDSFEFSLADGGEDLAGAAIGNFNFDVTPVNDAPKISGLGERLSYTENDLPTPIDETLSLTDPDQLGSKFRLWV